MTQEATYEVETRFHFAHIDEAMSTLPFLRDCLHTRVEWETDTYGLDLFRSDKLLRVSTNRRNHSTKNFLGYKEADIGRVCNIRLEQDEEITEGMTDSSILQVIKGQNTLVTPQNVSQLLTTLGHEKFMSFKGSNLIGKDETWDIALKLMTCSILEYPLLLEIEKTAKTRNETLQAEEDLQKFIAFYGLENRIVRKEPPTLLYEKIFGF